MKPTFKLPIIPAAAPPTPTPDLLRTRKRLVGPRRWWDWVLAFDPGLANLQVAWRNLVSLVVAFATGYGMAHAVDVTPRLGLMVGGVLAMISSLWINEGNPKRLARLLLFLPFPASGALALGVWLQPHRVADMWLAAAAMVVWFYLVRYGPFGLLAGAMIFSYFLFGTISPMPMEDAGRLALVIAVVAVALLTARLVLCYPTPREDLLRAQRAFVIQARRVAAAAADTLSAAAGRAAATRRMDHALHRLNVTTVTVDARLASQEDGEVAELLHRYLFDAEVALHAVATAVQQLGGRRIPPALRQALVWGLSTVRDAHLEQAHELRPAAVLIRQQAAGTAEGTGPDDPETCALARRIADLLESLADSITFWLDLGYHVPIEGTRGTFQPVVMLEPGGRPTGVGPTARKLAAVEHGKGWRGSISPYLRAPLQAAIALAITVPLADAVSPQHYYWALIGVIIAMLGPATHTERVRKSVERVAGTALGAVIGVVLLHLIGHGHPYAILTVMALAISLGTVGVLHYYTFFVIGLNVALVQLYGTYTPNSKIDWLMTQRVFENGVGLAVGVLCAAALFPLSNRKIIREATQDYLVALERLIAQISERWSAPENQVRLRGAARGVDAALYQTRSALRPAIRMPGIVRSTDADKFLAVLATASGHARALATAADVDIDPHLRDRAEHVLAALGRSLHELQQHLTEGRKTGTWADISPLIRELQSAVRGDARLRENSLLVALDELTALDETLAHLARNGEKCVHLHRRHPAHRAGHRNIPGPGDAPDHLAVISHIIDDQRRKP